MTQKEENMKRLKEENNNKDYYFIGTLPFEDEDENPYYNEQRLKHRNAMVKEWN